MCFSTALESLTFHRLLSLPLKQKVNNESSEIIRMFNSAFDRLVPGKAGINYYPDHLKTELDSVNEWIYDTVNNGVYKTGFATTQEAYDNNVYPLFKSLDRIEGMLTKTDYLVGNTLTEADLRLWTTILRFDPVYHGHFKCNIKSIEKDYPHILKWARRIYQMPKVAETVKMQWIKNGYYKSQVSVSDLYLAKRAGARTRMAVFNTFYIATFMCIDQSDRYCGCRFRSQPCRAKDLRARPRLVADITNKKDSQKKKTALLV
jgi:glutathionyl-hydroquinone reductase